MRVNLAFLVGWKLRDYHQSRHHYALACLQDPRWFYEGGLDLATNAAAQLGSHGAAREFHQRVFKDGGALGHADLDSAAELAGKIFLEALKAAEEAPAEPAQ